MIEAFCFTFVSLPMAWLSQCTVDQLFILILTCLVGVQTPQKQVLEFLVHMYLQEHATYITHMSILGVQIKINVNEAVKPHITYG
jgi:hypothetical protein